MSVVELRSLESELQAQTAELIATLESVLQLPDDILLNFQGARIFFGDQVDEMTERMGAGLAILVIIAGALRQQWLKIRRYHRLAYLASSHFVGIGFGWGETTFQLPPKMPKPRPGRPPVPKLSDGTPVYEAIRARLKTLRNRQDDIECRELDSMLPQVKVTRKVSVKDQGDSGNALSP